MCKGGTWPQEQGIQRLQAQGIAEQRHPGHQQPCRGQRGEGEAPHSPPRTQREQHRRGYRQVAQRRERRHASGWGETACLRRDNGFREQQPVGAEIEARGMLDERCAREHDHRKCQYGQGRLGPALGRGGEPEREGAEDNARRGPGLHGAAGPGRLQHADVERPAEQDRKADRPGHRGRGAGELRGQGGRNGHELGRGSCLVHSPSFRLSPLPVVDAVVPNKTRCEWQSNPASDRAQSSCHFHCVPQRPQNTRPHWRAISSVRRGTCCRLA